jgi:hypothetical protein
MYLHRASWHFSATLTEVFPLDFRRRLYEVKGVLFRDKIEEVQGYKYYRASVSLL